MNFTRNSTNQELLADATIQAALSNGKAVCFAEEASINNNKSLYFIQEVSVKNALDEPGTSLTLAAFVGTNGSKRLVRAIATVPVNFPMEAGKAYTNVEIKLERNTNPFRDKNSEKGPYPSQMVLNPKTGMISAIEGLPIYEHRGVVTRDPKSAVIEHDFSKLRVDGDTKTSITREEAYELLVNLGVDEERAATAAQLDFTVQEQSEAVQTAAQKVM